MEKLVRLAELFGVSLDELVRDIRPEEGSGRPDNGAAPILAVRMIVGVSLIWMGILFLFLALVLGSVGVFLAGLFLAVPFIGCGVICMVCRKRVGLWCGWMVFVPVDAYLQLFTASGRGRALASLYLPLYRHLYLHGILPSQLIISWIMVAVFVGLIALTLRSFRSLRLLRNPRTITLLAVGWVLRLVGLPVVADLMARRLPEKLAESGLVTYGGIYSTISFVMGRIEDVLLVLLLVYTAAVLRKRIDKREWTI